MKIARVATLELATRQVKNRRKKSPELKFSRQKLGIVARVATLQLFAQACDATKEYLANEISIRS